MTMLLERDRRDLKILTLRKKNAQLTNVRLADLVRLSPISCFECVQRLEVVGSAMEVKGSVD
jgi:DNA-binding Lrp family transcriptional regulator